MSSKKSVSHDRHKSSPLRAAAATVPVRIRTESVRVIVFSPWPLFSCAVAPSIFFAVAFDHLFARQGHLNCKPSFFQLPEAPLPSSAAPKPASATTLGQKKVASLAALAGDSRSSSASGGPHSRLPLPWRPASVQCYAFLETLRCVQMVWNLIALPPAVMLCQANASTSKAATTSSAGKPAPQSSSSKSVRFDFDFTF